MATFRELVLGWKVTKGLDPAYWLRADAKPGEQSFDDLVTVAPHAIARNTIVIAQSGSAKSFFIGRYIEEILLKTRSRVLILDQTSGFRDMAAVVPADRWNYARYDVQRGVGFLPTEPDRETFQSEWAPLSEIVKASRGLLRPNWVDLPVEWLFDEIGPVFQHQLRYCHGILKLVLEVMAGGRPPPQDELAFLRLARDFFAEIEGKSREYVISFIRDNYKMPSGHELAVQRAAIYNSFVTREAADFYFNVAHWMQEKGQIVFWPAGNNLSTRARVQVVDLASFSDPVLRTMVVNSILERELVGARNRWEAALAQDPREDMRVPTFIVIDDAHEFLLDAPKSQLHLRSVELFRTIASDCERFGLFLVLASPRPDKLDPLVISEFHNRAVMKIRSNLVLQKTVELLGLSHDSPRILERCLEFGPGRALLIGPWAGDSPQFMFTAPRRTIERGTGLRTEYWAGSG
jgi:hypothetical protein